MRRILAVAASVVVVAALARMFHRPQQVPEIIDLPDTTAMQPRVAARLRETHRLVTQHPASAEAWGRLGEVCHAHQLYAEAASCYRHARSLAPERHRWPYLLARVRQKQAAPWEEVDALFADAAGLRPDYAPTYVRQGRLRLGNGRAREAAAAFEQALAVEPALAVAHRGLGQALLAMDEPARAVAHLREAARFAPEDRATWAVLSQAYRRSGDRDAAVSAAERSRGLVRTSTIADPIGAEVKAMGVSPQHYADRGVALIRAGDFAGAIENLRIVAETQPDDPRVQMYLGTSYAAIGRPQLAMHHLAQATRLQEKLVEAHVRLATLLLERDELKRDELNRAIDHLARALVHAPEDTTVLAWLGSALHRRGDVDEALVIFARAAAAAPEQAGPRYNLATALMNHGDLDAAVREYRHALRLDPRHVDAHYNVALALERLGRIDEAIAHYEQAAKLDPTHPAADALGTLRRQRR
ncbi:MAG: tetratricopeptide repeat protein [Planctomycetes bacterium]|nr:tetratricopeptide repeat protein [Planctomycetota bacterium]